MYTVKSFIFDGYLISWLGQSMTKISMQFLFTLVIFKYNMKSMNSSVHKHTHHRRTTKFSAYEIKSFHST